MDETRYSTLRKLLHVTAFCLKFIKRKWNKCSDVLKQRVGSKHKIFKIIEGISDHGTVYSQGIKAARLLWVYIIQCRQYMKQPVRNSKMVYRSNLA